MRFGPLRDLLHGVSAEGPGAGSETRKQTTVTFESLAGRYDDLFSRSRISTQRGAVWEELAEVFRAGDAVLVLNCRTGEDAGFLAMLDVSAVGRDSVEGMSHVTLRPGTMFDGVLLNLSGLNSVVNLNQTAGELASLVTNGAPVIVCVSNRFCFSEALWFLLHGKYPMAFRRLSGIAMVKRGDRTVNIQYPALREVKSSFSPSFRMCSCMGLGIAVPPSYLEPILRKYPRVLCLLCLIDRRIRRLPFIRAMGDHMLLHFERVEG
jgi:hypothetical protein